MPTTEGRCNCPESISLRKALERLVQVQMYATWGTQGELKREAFDAARAALALEVFDA